MSITEEKEQGIQNTENENLPAVRNDQAVFQLMDALDDDLVKAELEGRITNLWVYHFTDKGQEVVGLSKTGVDAACNEFAKSGHVIEEGEAKWSTDPVDPEYMLFSITATRYLVNLETGERIRMETVNGAKRQGRKHKNGKFNPFFFETGVSKAARNARSRLIPEEVKAAIIAKARADGKVRKLTVEDLPKDKPKEETTEIMYAKDKDKRFLEAWIKEHLDGDREAFKEWAAELNMIHKENGKYSLNKVLYRFMARIRMNPDDAAANFSAWYDLKKAKETIKEVFGDDATYEEE